MRSCSKSHIASVMLSPDDKRPTMDTSREKHSIWPLITSPCTATQSTMKAKIMGRSVRRTDAKEVKFSAS